MLQQARPQDYVIATGRQYSVREFIIWTAAELGLALRFEGSGVDERGVVAEVTGNKAPGVQPGDCVVAVDARYFRPAEVQTLLGDPSKAKADLCWEPEITAQQMCAEMVAQDLQAARQTALLRRHGYASPVPREAT
jgi:GDPmannose 4,6-dehydratase